MARVSRNPSLMGQDQGAGVKASSKGTIQRPTRPKEFHNSVDERASDANRDDDGASKDEANEEDEDDYNEPTQFGGTHNHEPARTQQLRNLQQHQGHYQRHHQHSQHAPTCLASKLVNVELSSVEPASTIRYSDQPKCLHSAPKAPRQHKPSCVHHRQQVAPNGRRLFKGLINQQHVQLPSVVGSLKPPLVDRYAKSTNALEQFSHQRQRHPRHSRLSAEDKPRNLLAEHHHHRLRPTSSGMVYASSNNTRDIYADARINFRNFIHRPVAQLTIGSSGAARSPTAANSAQTSDRRTTIKFISQLYFLLHLSAMISLLLHHKNLVANEHRAIPQASQVGAELQQQFLVPTRRNSLVAREEAGQAGEQRRRLATQATPSPTLVSDENGTHILSPRLPVPQMFRLSRDEWQRHQEAGPRGQQQDQQPARRTVRSSFGTAGDETRVLDSRSSDILVRLMGRLHAKCALQYFLCYLLLSSVIILLLMWLARICHSKQRRGAPGSSLAGMHDRRERRHHAQVGTRRDCTPVLIGSISLGLIQLIVIGLEIADSVDWLTAPPASVGRSSAAEAELACHWPIFLPLLQFIFVSLLMQFILAMILFQLAFGERNGALKKVANNRGLIKKPASRRGFGDSLQNIALAHLLVTHILLWLMKLNSISLFQQQPTLAPFVMLPQPLTTTTTTTTTTSTTTTSTTTTTTPAPPSTTTTTIIPVNLAGLGQPSEREEKVLRSAKESPLVQTDGQRPNSTKTERDLRSAAERRPLAPNRAPPSPLQGPNQLVEMPKLDPPVAQVHSGARSVSSSASPQPSVAFKSSLPKRMTAFRQSRPTQRVNLPSFNVANSDSPPIVQPQIVLPPTTELPAFTTPSLPGTSTSAPQPKEKSGQRHKVRIIVNREQSFPAHSIDLRAVIPATAVSHANDDEAGQADEDDTSTAPPDELDGDYRRTTERPFPSVDDDPPPKRPTTTSTRRPPGAFQANASVSSPKRVASRDKARSVENSRVEADAERLGEEAVEEEDHENELDLDALLPPVPNYNDTSGPQDGEAAAKTSDRISSTRKARQMVPADNKTQQSPLDETAFAFNEAASSQVLNVTTESSLGALGEGTSLSTPPRSDNQSNQTEGGASLRLDSVRPEALVINQQQEFRPNQQHQQQQPTLTDFLLPIVQQYHILVLTILFNMWLDSMQRQAPLDSSGDAARSLRARATRLETGQPRARHSGEYSSFSELSPTLSSASYSAEQFDSSSISQSSSTRHLVDALELAKRQRKSDKLSDTRTRLRPVDSGRAPSSRSSGEQLVGLAWREETRVQLRPASRSQEISSSACSIFFGLLVVSCSLIVILLGIDLLSLLVQCLIQLLSILFCFVGLFVVWRLKKNRAGPGERAASRSRERALERERRASQSRANSSQPQAAAAAAAAATGQSCISQKSSFHYLFLLAAYYCGISIALNLGQQNQVQRLFPIQVIQFIQRWWSPHGNSAQHGPPLESPLSAANFDTAASSQEIPVQTIAINCQLLFYFAISLKGLILIVQVTIQTVLIRVSWCWPSARAKLRQIYTFLMFTNLSLWALEICDQQQQMQLIKFGQLAGYELHQHHLGPLQSASPGYELLSLEGFTRFSSSVVTLSHLYHGLVFMQH